MNDTMGRTVNTVMTESVMLTKLDSTNQANMSPCTIGINVPKMRANVPAIYGEERWSNYK